MASILIYNIDHQVIPSMQQLSSNNQQHNPSHEQESLYDNDYNVSPIPPPSTAEYSYTTITHSGQQRPEVNSKMNNNFEMESCEAYGTTAY